MPRVCTICNHEQRAEIDAALVDGKTFRYVAERFGTSITALHRHKRDHLPVGLAKAQQAREVAQADDLLTQVKRLQTVTMNILAHAYQAQDLRTALQAIAQARQNLELLARLLGELEAQSVKVAVLVTSPEWLRLRGAILAALDSYPDARRAVIESIRDAAG